MIGLFFVLCICICLCIIIIIFFVCVCDVDIFKFFNEFLKKIPRAATVPPSQVDTQQERNN